MQNGENLQALHKNLDFVRFFSILLLLIHFYSTCYEAILERGLAVPFISHLIFTLSHGLFFLSGIILPKLAVLLLLLISQIGQQGKKDEKLRLRPNLTLLLTGLSLYFLSYYCLTFSLAANSAAICYIAITSTGYLLILLAGARISRMLTLKMGKDPFNTLEETFPQEERLLENEYSINLPALYKLKGQVRKSYINLPNPFRGVLVLGTPGSRRKRKEIRKKFFCDPACDHSTHSKRFYLLYL